MSIRKPLSKLAKPNSHLLAKGTVIERVHSRRFVGNAFNPGVGGPTRFAPFDDECGRPVPTLYAANTLEAAIYETIFHDVPAKSRKKRVSKTLIVSRAHGQLELKRNLKLASLREADLKKWRIKRNELITSSPRLYLSTVKWAAAIHHQFPDIEGLVWTSNQCDPNTAYVFFGDRVSSSDLNIIASRDGQIDTTFLSDVRIAGQRSGINITL